MITVTEGKWLGGTVSVTVDLGLDGGFVEWSSSRWPAPDDLADDMVALRHCTLVEHAAGGRLRGAGAWSRTPSRLVVCDPTADADAVGVLGRRSAVHFLRAAHRGAFIHVSGGIALTRLALEADVVGEIDATLYPEVGGTPLTWNGVAPTFERLSASNRNDGRVVTAWRRSERRG